MMISSLICSLSTSWVNLTGCPRLDLSFLSSHCSLLLWWYGLALSETLGALSRWSIVFLFYCSVSVPLIISIFSMWHFTRWYFLLHSHFFPYSSGPWSFFDLSLDLSIPLSLSLSLSRSLSLSLSLSLCLVLNSYLSCLCCHVFVILAPSGHKMLSCYKYEWLSQIRLIAVLLLEFKRDNLFDTFAVREAIHHVL